METCWKSIPAMSVHTATSPTTTMRTTRVEKRLRRAGSASAVGVSATRASRRSWSTCRLAPRRPMTSRVWRGSTTRWSMGAIEASCAVVSEREAASMARSAPTASAVSARA